MRTSWSKRTPPSGSPTRATISRTRSRSASCSDSGTASHMARWPCEVVHRSRCSASRMTACTGRWTVRTSTSPARRKRSSTPASEANGPRRPLARASSICWGSHGVNSSSTCCQRGSWGPNVVTPRRPPGTSRPAQVSTATTGSGRKNSTSDAATTSREACGSPGSRTSATATRTCGRWARSRAVSSTMRGARSIPSTSPSGPTASASTDVAAPRPHPRSRTRSPGRTSSCPTRPRAMGRNHGTPTSS